MDPELDWKVVEIAPEDGEALEAALNRSNWGHWNYEVFALVPRCNGIIDVVFRRKKGGKKE